MSRLRKHRLLYPLGAILFAAVQYIGTEINNGFNAIAQRADDTLATGSEIINQAELTPEDPVAAAWKGVACWTGIFALIRFGFPRRLIKTCGVFTLGFMGVAIPAGRKIGSRHDDDDDVGFIVICGTAGGAAVTAAYYFVTRSRNQ